MIKHQLLVLIVCSAGVAACVPHHARTQAALGATPELVYADSPAVWFEDMASAAVLEDGRRWVVGEGSARRVLDSPGGGVVAREPLQAPQVPNSGEAPFAYRSREDSRELIIGEAASSARYRMRGRIREVIWSQDRSVVYALLEDEIGAGTVVRVDPANGDVDVMRTRLYTSNRSDDLALSADGTRLYLALAAPLLTSPETRHNARTDRDLDIYELDVRTRTLRVIAATPADEFAPVVDGAHLYWTRNAYSEAVVLVRSDGGRVQEVIRDAILPTWHPDGRRLAFTIGVASMANGPLAQDVAMIAVSSDGEPIGSMQPLVSGYHEDMTAVWSPDGSWLAYHSHRSTTPVARYGGAGTTDDIYLRRPAAPASTEIRLTDFGWEVGMPDWSRDGRRIAFTSWERGGARGVSKPWIVTIDPATGERAALQRIPLPPGVESATNPRWSPVSGRIALDVARGTRRELWVLGPDGSDPRKLWDYESTTVGGLDWTPDGEAIIVSALVGRRMQLFLVPLDGTPPRQLTSDHANLLHPRVSPDGQWIAAMRLERVKEIWRIWLQ